MWYVAVWSYGEWQTAVTFRRLVTRVASLALRSLVIRSTSSLGPKICHSKSGKQTPASLRRSVDRLLTFCPNPITAIVALRKMIRRYLVLQTYIRQMFKILILPIIFFECGFPVANYIFLNNYFDQKIVWQNKIYLGCDGATAWLPAARHRWTRLALTQAKQAAGHEKLSWPRWMVKYAVRPTGNRFRWKVT